MAILSCHTEYCANGRISRNTDAQIFNIAAYIADVDFSTVESGPIKSKGLASRHIYCLWLKLCHFPYSQVYRRYGLGGITE